MLLSSTRSAALFDIGKWFIRRSSHVPNHMHNYGPFALSVFKIHIRFDTQYAVWISCRANVAPKSNLIQLGSAHEWSGVWTGPYAIAYVEAWKIQDFNITARIIAYLIINNPLLCDIERRPLAWQAEARKKALMSFQKTL